jgi:hypothetical protein
MTDCKQTVNNLDKPQNATCKLQVDKFVDLARQIEADEDEAHWEERLKAVARQKPKDAPEKPE